MRQEAIYADSKVQFAGHETFPLRLLWLKKAFDAVKDGAPSGTFQEQDAIARFGVGRNMAVSMRHWALASGFFEETDRQLSPTSLGRLLLSDGGLDPYLERPATVWLCHLHIAATPEVTTTAFHAFNALNAIEFDSATLIDDLFEMVTAKGWRATRGTIKRDVEVFLRSYVRKGDVRNEDAAEPLLAELGLVREARLGGWYEFVRGPKPNLPDGVFAYGLADFWQRQGGTSTLAAEQICYAPGSPGRVFKLDEDSVITRLMHLAELTDNAWQWTDTAGLRQVQKRGDIDPLSLVAAAYPSRPLVGVAA
ncbi:DUF4007 family protein [Chenggangzhangella methanolivorans]|uniref:DUF4007 family protein n=3 Tax=Methylopilaceae TaxID=3149309 RepID=A0A4Q0M9W5_9HYPH|nr:DUF4007 family protein [Chenggangzhangella methanolivorans]QZO00571.1 DUF4007 family protein [Chenggangzhangella methanolivorans]RXF69997.1 DUF4007 family protein [Hansschlegelia zhihuaiae]